MERRPTLHLYYYPYLVGDLVLFLRFKISLYLVVLFPSDRRVVKTTRHCRDLTDTSGMYSLFGYGQTEFEFIKKNQRNNVIGFDMMLIKITRCFSVFGIFILIF